jgi:CRISPR-associated protein Csh1
MIEAIREIGEYANKSSGDNNLLENFSKKIPFEKKNKKGQLVKQHVVIFNFDLKNQIIECSFEEVGEDSGKKYLWLGNNPGNKPQIFFTSDVFSFIFGESLSNINERVTPPLKSELQNVMSIFFESDDGFSRVKLEKFGCLDEDTRSHFVENFEKIKTDLEKENLKDRAKKILRKYLDELNKIVLKLLKPGLEADEVAVFTVAINGNLLVQREEYRKMLYNEKIGCLFDPKNKTYKNNFVRQGNCSLCDKKNLATTSTATNLSFKFYMTDKLGFSSDLDGKFTKNFNICEMCYSDLLSGERFIDNNLKTYLGGISCYVIPNLLFKNPDLNYFKFSQYVTHKNNALSNLNTLPEFEKELKKFREFEEDEKNNFVINYLFYRKGKSDFKILKLIKDVPPSRLDTINDILRKISTRIDREYPLQNNYFKISLKSIYYTIPIGNNDRAYSTFLGILDAIFSARSIDYSFLIEQYTEVLRIIFYERGGYNISPKSWLEMKALQLNFALLFFKELKLLRGLTMEKDSDIDSIPADIKKFWETIGIYDNPRKTLFLLGYMVGNIGNSQYRSGHKTKPILNKINFQGMTVQSILRLTNEVFEKMIQYKILKYNESVFHQYKKMIDTYSQNWNLTNQENVFYILSGYSFVTYQAISKGEIEVPSQIKTDDDGGEVK